MTGWTICTGCRDEIARCTARNASNAPTVEDRQKVFGDLWGYVRQNLPFEDSDKAKQPAEHYIDKLLGEGRGSPGASNMCFLSRRQV